MRFQREIQPGSRWLANAGYRQHLFPPPFICVTSACNTAYSGEAVGESKAPRCAYCAQLEAKAKKR